MSTIKNPTVMSFPLSAKGFAEEMAMQIKQDFPFFREHPDVIYLDNAATTQKPEFVLQAMNDFLVKHNANPSRGLYDLSIQATQDLESARQMVAQKLLRYEPEQVIFTSGATMSLNLAALLLEPMIGKGDEIAVSVLEHHSNLLPWQNLAKRKGAKLVWIYPDENGEIRVEQVLPVMSKKTKVLALTAMSNVLGQLIDIESISLAIKKEHPEIVVVTDASQSLAYLPIAAVGDLICFSGHKLFGPTGIGVLAGRRDLLEKLDPVFVGGGMIEQVTPESYTAAPLPHKFEAGTVNVVGAVGLEAAIRYKSQWSSLVLYNYIQSLTGYTIQQLRTIKGLHFLGDERKSPLHTGILSFVLDGVHPHDVAAVLAQEKICVRAGHHCAAVLHQHLGINASVRVSLAIYNSAREIDRLAEVLSGVRKKLGHE